MVSALCLAQVARMLSASRRSAPRAPRTSSAATSERRHVQFRASYVKKRNYARVKDGERDGNAIYRAGPFFTLPATTFASFTLRSILLSAIIRARRSGKAARRERRDLHLVSPALFVARDLSALYSVRAHTRVIARCVTIVRHGHTFVRYRK